MRLIRGSGVDGLAGIRAVRDDGVIRPLIDCERGDVLAFLGERGIRYASDSMNNDPRFLRTRVRRDVLPLLRMLNPRLTRTLAKTADLATADADFLDGLAAEAARARTKDDGTIDVASRDLPRALNERMLRHWLKLQRGTLKGIGAVHLEALYRLARAAGAAHRVEIPGDGVVVGEYGVLRFHRGGAVHQRDFLLPVRPGIDTRLDCGWQLSVDLRPASGDVPPDERSLWHFWADAETIGHDLQIREARRGDKIQPFGLRGHRKLQDVFTDRKLPHGQRWGRPVLEAEGVLLWVPGLVRSNQGLITPATRTAWRVVIHASPVAGG
jgi:tRNA(Ile)-lysidine synthase